MINLLDKEELIQQHFQQLRKSTKEYRKNNQKVTLLKMHHSIKGLKKSISSYEQEVIAKNCVEKSKLNEFKKMLVSVEQEINQFSTVQVPKIQTEQVPPNRQALYQKGKQLAKDNQNLAGQMLRDLHQAHNIADQVNLQIDRQIEKLDQIEQDAKDTKTTLKRAAQHIKYFGRQVYTDKILICLLILVVLAIIAVIILTIVKGGNNFQIADILKI